MKKLWRRFRFIFNVRKFLPFLKEFFLSKEVSPSKKLLSLVLIGLYAVLPFDLIPDFLGFFGILDDVTILMFVLQYIVKLAPQTMREKYNM
ncbi:YkvA family protein [Ectobacillus panaciterrae]|uniref:YkvA family protein n=1 Tax=Ectobacillus panaciterrae TaxID=363872 RepID=UPI00041C6756|nr:DUF1232 domain-containing protein [Ectobacillus panaciterrae]